MAFTIVCLALIFQRLFEIENRFARYDLFLKYYQWIHERFSKSDAWSGLSGMLVVVLPAFIVFSIFMMFVYHVAGSIVYYVVSLFITWYYLDARFISKKWVGSVKVPEVLALSYQRIFAVIFWFALLGAVGVVLYTLIASLRIELEGQEQLSENEDSLLKATIESEGLLDWVPVRLLGLTYALVGEFGPTFQVWYKSLFTGIGRTREQISSWAMVSLGLQAGEGVVLDNDLTQSINSLINRSIVVWVVVLALFALGSWIG